MGKITRKNIRKSGGGVNVVADLNAVVAASAERRGQRTGTSNRQRVRIVQRDGHTTVIEENDEQVQEDG